jgi:hypothetical protein
MTIQEVARELIELKNRADEAAREYAQKRDEMHNALLGQPSYTFEHDGFRFVCTTGGTVRSVTKGSVISALQAENLPPDVLYRIIGAALVESERWGGLRILRVAG